MSFELFILMSTNGTVDSNEAQVSFYSRINVPPNRELFDLMLKDLAPLGKLLTKPAWSSGLTTNEGVKDDCYGFHLRHYSANQVGQYFKFYQPSKERGPKDQELRALSAYLLLLPDSYRVVLYWH